MASLLQNPQNTPSFLSGAFEVVPTLLLRQIMLTCQVKLIFF